MGHRISGVLLRGAFDRAAARRFELEVIPLPQDLTLLPVDIYLLEFWGVVTGNTKRRDDGIRELLFPSDDVLFDIVEALRPGALFAVIATDYFGGIGTQAAAVYRGRDEVMAPTIGGINAALRHLGIRHTKGIDAFESVELDRHRHCDALDDCDWDARYRERGLERP
ncbi:MAG: hypothetical protein KC486_17205 [Myxococcales bacterium]|nr:hypothetical protein [Myxococcales bacterium]